RWLERGALVCHHCQRIRLLTRRAARTQQPDLLAIRSFQPALQLRERLCAQRIQLGALTKEVTLVVRQMRKEQRALLLPLGMELQVNVQLLEGVEPEGQAACVEPRAQNVPLRRTETEPVILAE